MGDCTDTDPIGVGKSALTIQFIQSHVSACLYRLSCSFIGYS